MIRYLLPFLFLSGAALAQPACTTAAPNSVACQSQAASLAVSDILLGQQATGPQRANQSVKVSLSQILSGGFPASFGATTLTSLTMGANTATGFGTAIGNVPLFIDWNSTGIPGLKTGARIILGATTPASNDYANFQFLRNTTYSGGTLSNINANARVQTVMGANDGTNTWNLTAELTTSSRSGLGVGFYAYAKRASGTGAPIGAGGVIIGSVTNAWDDTGNPSSTAGNAVAAEFDVQAVEADDRTNLRGVWGYGSRKGLHVAQVRANDSNTNPYGVSNGIWFSQSKFDGTQDTNSYFGALIGVATGTAAYQALDTREVVAPTGSTEAVAAVRMSSGQIIDFNAGATMNPAAGNYLQYTTSGTSRLRYMAGATEALSVDNSGNATVYGSVVAGASGSAALTLASGAISVPSGQNLTMNMGGNNATLTFAGTSGTGTPLRLTASTTQNVIDASLTAANLMKTSRLFVSPGTITFSGSRSDTGAPFSASANAAGSVASTTDYPYYWWRINSDIATTTQAASGIALSQNYGVTPWTASTAYALNAQAENDNGRVYQVTVAGTSAGAGGPTGTGATIVDNTVTWTYVGANSTGGRTGFRVELTARGTTGNGRAGQDSYYEGVRSSVRSGYNYGGTNALLTGARGHQFSFAGYSYALSGTSYLYANIGYEQDMIIESGVTVARQIAFHPVKLAASVTQAVVTDAAIMIGNAAGAVGWRDGILFSDPGDIWGIDTTNGTLMRARLGSQFLTYPASVKDGINIQEATASGSAFLTRNGSWDGSGNLRIGTGYLSITSTGIQIDSSYSVGLDEGTAISGGTIVSGGTNGFAVNDVLRSSNGGVIYVNSVNGSNQITGATVYRRSYASGSPAVNENYTPDPGSAGTGTVTIAQTWTAGSVTQIGSGATSVLIGSGSALSTSATTGFLKIPTMAGAPSGTVGSAGQAAVVIDTTNNKICWSTGGGTWKCALGS